MLLRLILISLVIALLWNLWSLPAPEEQPPLAYGEQTTRSNWPQLSAASNYTDTRDLLKSNYYVILDGSANMNEKACGSENRGIRMRDVIEAFSAFSDAVPRQANIGAAVFNHNEIVELGALHQEERISHLRISPGGPARLRSAIQSAYEKLELQGQKQLGYGEYHLVVISSGDVADGEDPGSFVRDMLASSPVNLTTIGYCTAPDHHLDRSGPGPVIEADSLEMLKQSLHAVLVPAPSFTVDSFQETQTTPGKVVQGH
ncbi:MAG: vWA domain-containing protein [Pseudomonadota bacterium]